MQHRKTPLVSEKLILQRRKRRTFFISVFSLIISVLSVLIFFVFRATPLFIENVEVLGNKIVDRERIEEVVLPLLNEHYFIVFPKKNRLIYPKQEIEMRIRKAVGRVENVSLEVSGKTLFIEIVERGSFALWCKEKKENCYFLDSTGLIFSHAPAFSDGVYKIFEGMIFDTEPLGKQFLNEELLSLNEEISHILSEVNFDVYRIKINTLRDTEFILKNGPMIKIDLTKSATTTKDTLKTLFASQEFKKISSDFKNLDYIDARFGSKIFFKSLKMNQSAASTMSLE